MSASQHHIQRVLAVFIGALVLVNGATLAWLALLPAESQPRKLVPLIVLLLTLLLGALCITFVPRLLLRPLRSLVAEAERAPVGVASQLGRAPVDEAQFVLETFQAVVSKLQAQQRELERLSQQATARAATAEEFNERIVASVPSGLIAFDYDGRATTINQPARALLQLNDQSEGRSAADVLRHAPELHTIVARCLATGEVYRREEIAARDAQGKPRCFGVTVAPIDLRRTDASGATRSQRGALCLLTDITEIAELREQVQLKRNLESLGEMAAGLTHEFKNSLATLHGYAQLLERSETNQDSRRNAGALRHEVQNLTEMVTAFLNFARPRPLALVETSLTELIEDCRHELAELYDERLVGFETEGDFATLPADERMLRQALLNLLRNAAEAIDEQAANRQVTVRGQREQDADGRAWQRIEIEDTGTGIAPDALPKIFIPFFTTKSNGYGVGLALAHRVITDHGGTLTAANTPHGGARFTLKLLADEDNRGGSALV